MSACAPVAVWSPYVWLAEYLALRSACRALVVGCDRDGDGVPDVQDNCPSVFNPWQDDWDLDGRGDVCDRDDDNDATPDRNDPRRCDPRVTIGYVGTWYETWVGTVVDLRV